MNGILSARHNGAVDMSQMVMPREMRNSRLSDVFAPYVQPDGSIPVQVNQLTAMTPFLDVDQPYVQPSDEQDAWVPNYNWDALKMQNTNFINDVISTLPNYLTPQKKAAYVTAIQASNRLPITPVNSMDISSDTSHYGSYFSGARNSQFKNGFVKPRQTIDMSHLVR
jgi:hypothetical protein